MLKDAYKRIEKFKQSNQKAIDGITDNVLIKIKFEIKSTFHDSKVEQT